MRTNEPLKGLSLIKEYFKHNIHNTDLGLFEFGIDWCRFDLLILNAHKKYFRGFEFKVTRADFLNDIKRGKWKAYLKYCHTFTWVCPAGLIKKNEIESPAGLLWIGEQESHGCYDRTYHIYKGHWVKRPQRIGDISRGNLDRIILLLVQRVKWRKEDFF